MSYILKLILSLIISLLEPIVKKTKPTWDDLIVKILKVVNRILSIGGFRK